MTIAPAGRVSIAKGAGAHATLPHACGEFKNNYMDLIII
jgi:hypothetical protein